MSQNIYDNPTFFAGYATLPRSVEGLDGAPEWPALRAMLPDLKDLRVVDLGCGYGWFCRYAQQHGAREVLGIDVSEKMLAQATAMTSSPNIRYQRADLDTLQLDKTYDLAYSSLALHYLSHIEPLFTTLFDALKPGGMLIFSCEHPIYTAPLQQQWIVDDQQQRSWPINHYQQEGERISNWFADGVKKQHRKLASWINALIGAGFEIVHLDEWGPADEQVKQNPGLEEERDRPMMFLLSARKPQ
ncbi:class I SAM-dependent methyltransferase [Pantoea sp. EABMAA-21]|nr:class I SAM-dependent methyltransferase [Pantoea sp. EABMAA-21]MDI9276029.1 class I SAM-dependent methyltransferase [Pantoea sp. EABMAA-21]